MVYRSSRANGGSGHNEDSYSDLGFTNNSPKVTQNVNYAVSKVDTLLFISVIIAIFSCASAYFIGKRIGIQEEKVGQIEGCVFNNKCNYKGVVK